MFGGSDKRKPLAEMTRGDIVAAMIAFLVIGMAILVACLAQAMASSDTIIWAWDGLGAVFVVAVVFLAERGYYEELMRRRGK